MHRVVVAGWYGYGNVGDEAILESILGALGAATGGALDCVVLTDRPRATAERHGIRSVALHGARALLTRTLAIRRADLFVLGGGGFLADWQPDAPRRWLAAPRIACALGTKVMGYGLGAGPLRSADGRRRVRTIMGRFAAVTVRDSTSRQWLEQTGLRAPVEVTGDPAVSLTPVEGPELEALLADLGLGAPRRRIVWALAPLYDREELWPGMQAKLARYVATCRAMMRWALDRTDAELLMWPFHPERDEPFQRMLLGEVAGAGRARCLSRPLRPAQVAAVLGRCDLVVGTRFHATVLAAVGGTVPVAIAYHHKVRCFMEQLGLEDFTIHTGDGVLYDAADPDPDEAVAVLRRAWEERTALAAQVRRRMHAVRQREMRNVEVAARLLGTGP